MQSKFFQKISKSKTLKIVNFGWRVFKISFEDLIQNKEGHPLLGEVDFEAGTIKLFGGLKDPMAREVLLHELTHIILETVGLGDDILKGAKLNNEFTTDQITRGFLILYNLNPKLSRLINDFNPSSKL